MLTDVRSVSIRTLRPDTSLSFPALRMVDPEKPLSRISDLYAYSDQAGPGDETVYSPNVASTNRSASDRDFELNLASELQQLLRSGETITLDELIQRFPDQADQLRLAFQSAVEQIDIEHGSDEQIDGQQIDAANPVDRNSGSADPPSEPRRSPAARQPRHATPESLGRYAITEALGSGGFGVVYRGWDEQLQREVAIKVAHRRPSQQFSTAAYLEEARFLARLDHPGIVPVYDVGKSDRDQLYIVSKFVDGGDLARRIRESRPGHRESARLTASIADALDYAHNRGVVHRDIKPGNIILTADDQPIVADFGLAIREADFGHGATFVGTPAYMSPEQARQEGHRVDGRSDVYSLGVILYELLTGVRPFNASSVSELLDLIRKVEVRPPRQLDRTIPKELERICLKAVSKRVADRYSTAGDFADDLRQWIATQTSIVHSVSGSLVDSQQESAQLSGSSRAVPVTIVPRGLRSFEASDRDFFLQLLPGARDRDGVPESVRFWKTRIEEADPDETFRVGVLLGPTGSGKSSLVRAGLIPILSENIRSITIDAGVRDLEQRLLNRIQKHVPALESATTLRDALVAVRQGRGLPAGRKLLLVFDQFEQWLNFHGLEETSELIEALRQCDGARLQALFLIRDDFTVAATQFMDALEEPLSQTRNFATVDMFGRDHARRVLEAFGRSYGALADVVPREQQRFLDEAIDGLAQEGQIVPIQIALFAEMVKDQPWTLNTLRTYGGTRGLGVQFLEEKLNGASAHPFLVKHRELTRQLLEELMPDDSQQIKGQPRTRSELFERFAQQARPDTLDRILMLLDSELRLITPTGNDPSSSTVTDSSVREPAYQLAHDYLIPMLRNWLTAEDRSTRRGRARLQLKEMSESWAAQPTPNRLPTSLQWLRMRLLTRSSDWSAAQRQFINAGRRRLVLRHSVSSAILIVTVVAAAFWFGQRRVNELSERLLSAGTAEVPGIIDEMSSFSRWVIPELQRRRTGLLESMREPAENHSIESRRHRRQRLHIALALAGHDDNELDYLLEHIGEVDPADLLPVAGLLEPHADRIRDRLFDSLSPPLSSPGVHPLHAAGLLARLDNSDPRWQALALPLTRQLTRVRPFQLPEWIAVFTPVRDRITAELIRMGSSAAELTPAERANLMELISRYARDQPGSLVSALEFARPNEFHVLFEPLSESGEQVNRLLRDRFRTLARDPEAATVWDPSDDPLGPFDGCSSNRGAIAFSIPLEQFSRIDRQLTDTGLQLSSWRLSRRAEHPLVAATWVSGTQTTSVLRSLSLKECDSISERALRQELQIIDLEIDSTSGPDQPARFTLVVAEQPTNSRTRLSLQQTFSELNQLMGEMTAAGFFARRQAVMRDPDGITRVSTLWVHQDEPSSNYCRIRPGKTFANVYPGYLQSDVRYLTDRDFSVFDLKLSELDSPDSATEQFARATALFETGARGEAIEMLRQSMGQSPNVAAGLALLLARDGQAAEFTEIRESLRDRPLAPQLQHLLDTHAAVLANDPEQLQLAIERLEADYSAAGNASKVIIDCSRGLAAAHAASTDSPRRETYRDRCLELLEQLSTTASTLSMLELLASSQFDSIRREARFQKLLESLEINRHYLGIWTDQTTHRSELVQGLRLENQVSAARQRLSEGAVPVTATRWDEQDEDGTEAVSLWYREVQPLPQLEQRAMQLALLSIALARLQETDALVEVLRDVHGRQARTFCIQHLPGTGLAATQLLRLFRRSDSVRLRTSLLLALSGFRQDQFEIDERQALSLRLSELTQTANESDLRAAAETCLRQWNQPVPTVTPTAANRERNWSVNSIGQIMIRLGPAQFVIGSPFDEPDRGRSEQLIPVEIPRTFELADRETTVGQFRMFLEDPEVQARMKARDETFRYATGLAPTDEYPQISVSWYMAARFCQWMSEREGLPESEWVYPGIESADMDTYQLPSNYLERGGYRLPTEMEWEYACRSLGTDSRSYGSSDESLSNFGWFNGNSDLKAHPVAGLFPNSFGLFDMLGNVNEWCQEPFQPYASPTNSRRKVDEVASDLTARPAVYRVIRGGSYQSLPSALRSAERSRSVPTMNGTSVGFRVARTAR